MKPFLKWAGGKAWALDTINKYITKAENYYEPFLGAGAVAINQLEKEKFKNYYLSDLNFNLMRCWGAVAYQTNNFIVDLSLLEDHYNSLDYEDRGKFFYECRKAFNLSGRPDLLIFLNKNCFNGLYRVNQKNEFNVPWTKYKKDTVLYDRENIISLSNTIREQSVWLSTNSFQEIEVKDNSFVYLDPPYERTFKGYNKDGFNLLKELKDYVIELDKRGIKFLLSNSYNDITLETFKDFQIDLIEAPRRISCKAKDRKPVYEILVTNAQKDENSV